jgi:hypothetical protein
MSSRLFDKGRDAYLEKLIGWTADTQKAMLLDMTVAGTWLKQITNVTNANPAVYTSTAHGFSNNDIVVVLGVKGNLSTNQIGRVASAAANTFQLVTLQQGLAVAGSGAYTSGGSAINLTQAQFVTDILGGRIGADVSLAGTSSTAGIANASNWTWTAVTGNPAQAVILYDAAGGSDATNRLVCYLDGQISVVVDKAVASTDTSIIIEPAKAGIPNGTVLTFSNGQALTVNATVSQGDRAITILSAGGAVPAGHTAETYATQAGLPVTPNGGNINFVVGTIYAPNLPTGLFML